MSTMTEPATAHKAKIMHITYDMRIGGTEMVIKNIIEGCDTARFDMSIFCIEAPLGPWGEALKQKGIAITTHARSPGFDTSLIKSIRQHVKAHNIDVLHCHQYTPWVYGTMAAVGLGKKIIFTEHGRFYPDVSSWKRRFVNPVLAMLSHRITAISHATKQALIEYEFINENDIEVVYNGIEGLIKDKKASSALRASLGIPSTDTVFGTIARLDSIKNHKMMLEAFAAVLEKDTACTLVIVGDGDLMESLQSQANKLNISHKVVFTGYITYPKDHLAFFDVFLLSSFSEGTSMTLLEAMSIGKPCVVTDAGGNKEIIKHEETGLVTDNDHMDQFADAMLTLAMNKEKTLEFGINAKKRFRQHFTVSQMSAQYSQLYND